MNKFTHALCRRPGSDLAGGITTADLGAPDFQQACRQFDRYVDTLRDCGLDVTVLDALPGYPDAHFVEDTAVVTPDVAVVTRPGALARQGEQQSIAEALAVHRPLESIEPPGTLDGGDVLMIGTHFLIGLSARTNEEGARRLGAVLESHGNTWQTISVAAGLHFKSSVNLVAPDTLLVAADFADRTELADFRLIRVPPNEEYAANVLLVNERLIMPEGYPRTREELDGLGVEIVELDTGEFRKMDGGLTCLSLRF
ncbi:MAG: arginine deiminase family protein [Candidatus Krumholzibacteriota bacterium]